MTPPGRVLHLVRSLPARELLADAAGLVCLVVAWAGLAFIGWALS